LKLLSNFVLSQTVAAIAFALGITAFQMKSRRVLLVWIGTSAVANACHFFILNLTAPGILFLFMGSRSYVAAFTVNKKIMCLFLAAIVAAFCLSYERPVELIGLVGTLLATCGTFQKGHQTVRIMFMMGNACWVLHNLLVVTPVAALMEATFLTSSLVGFWRFRSIREVTAGDPSLRDSGKSG
jgi:hypothetical protein